MKSAIVACLMISMAGAAIAQNVLVPANRTSKIESGCQVTGLDPNGDGFLALRAGPNTSHPQIGSLRNDDVAYIAGGPEGRWIYVEDGVIDKREAKFRGWIYDAWCTFYP